MTMQINTAVRCFMQTVRRFLQKCSMGHANYHREVVSLLSAASFGFTFITTELVLERPFLPAPSRCDVLWW